MLSRRDFITGMCSTAAFAMASTLYPGISFANARTDKRLVIVILRGGMDGLAALPPYADKRYDALRGSLALSDDAIIKVDPFFGLHPSLEPLAALYKDGDMIAVPATASSYRERSHFDAQNVLELGSIKPNGLNDGWINRLVGAIDENDGSLGMALGQGVPLMARGQNAVGSWAPSVLPDVGEDYMSLVRKVYNHDPIFANSFDKALNLQDMTMDAMTGNERKMARKSRSPQAFVTMSQMAGRMLVRPDGPRIATLELGGWDTHANQGTEGGRMANNLSLFARGIVALKKELGSEWNKTVVIGLTEFGRTARPNGDRGTDHGTAGVTFLFGGALNGGRIHHNWPGLSDADLYQNRDLRPTIDIRSITKGVIQEHYGLSEKMLKTHIYPSSGDARAIRHLVKS